MPRIPMPSPNGTNRAGLYLTPGSRAAAAYDAMPGGEGAPDDMQAVIEFLSDKLERGDLVKVCRMLGLDDDAAGGSAEDRRRVGASDAAARNAYAADARDLHRRGIINTQEMERRIMAGPPRRETEADRRRFAEMFPNASRLKVL